MDNRAGPSNQLHHAGPPQQGGQPPLLRDMIPYSKFPLEERYQRLPNGFSLCRECGTRNLVDAAVHDRQLHEVQICDLCQLVEFRGPQYFAGTDGLTAHYEVHERLLDDFVQHCWDKLDAEPNRVRNESGDRDFGKVLVCNYPRYIREGKTCDAPFREHESWKNHEKPFHAHQKKVKATRVLASDIYRPPRPHHALQNHPAVAEGGVTVPSIFGRPEPRSEGGVTLPSIFGRPEPHLQSRPAQPPVVAMPPPTQGPIRQVPGAPFLQTRQLAPDFRPTEAARPPPSVDLRTPGPAAPLQLAAFSGTSYLSQEPLTYEQGQSIPARQQQPLLPGQQPINPGQRIIHPNGPVRDSGYGSGSGSGGGSGHSHSSMYGVLKPGRGSGSGSGHAHASVPAPAYGVTQEFENWVDPPQPPPQKQTKEKSKSKSKSKSKATSSSSSSSQQQPATASSSSSSAQTHRRQSSDTVMGGTTTTLPHRPSPPRRNPSPPRRKGYDETEAEMTIMHPLHGATRVVKVVARTGEIRSDVPASGSSSAAGASGAAGAARPSGSGSGSSRTAHHAGSSAGGGGGGAETEANPAGEGSSRGNKNKRYDPVREKRVTPPE